MPAKTIKCENCGEIVITYNPRSKYCSDACRYEAKTIRNRLLREEHKGEKKPAAGPEVMSTLAETNQAAREAGMSYGQYVAQLWLKEHKW